MSVSRQKKDAGGVPDTAVFSCRYSFEHVHFNIYGFTAQYQNRANVLPILCQLDAMLFRREKML